MPVHYVLLNAKYAHLLPFVLVAQLVITSVQQLARYVVLHVHLAIRLGLIVFHVRWDTILVEILVLLAILSQIA